MIVPALLLNSEKVLRISEKIVSKTPTVDDNPCFSFSTNSFFPSNSIFNDSKDSFRSLPERLLQCFWSSKDLVSMRTSSCKLSTYRTRKKMSCVELCRWSDKHSILRSWLLKSKSKEYWMKEYLLVSAKCHFFSSMILFASKKITFLTFNTENVIGYPNSPHYVSH